jgi:hypothetical protein
VTTTAAPIARRVKLSNIRGVLRTDPARVFTPAELAEALECSTPWLAGIVTRGLWRAACVRVVRYRKRRVVGYQLQAAEDGAFIEPITRSVEDLETQLAAAHARIAELEGRAS